MRYLSLYSIGDCPGRFGLESCTDRPIARKAALQSMAGALHPSAPLWALPSFVIMVANNDRGAMTDYDTPWKEILEHYFQDFVAFFYPQAHADIDWGRGHAFLDKELAKVVRDAEAGQRRVDKLVKVWRKSGTEVWVLIHVEIQAQRETNFPRRMYVYNYRLFDRYNRPVASFAILADTEPGWRPSEFHYELWGSEVRL